MDQVSLSAGARTLNGLSRINILLGKNGCGKSVLLREIQRTKAGIGANIGYIVPERAGTLVYESGVVQMLSKNPEWLSTQRQNNSVENFMQQAVAQFAKLEIQVMRNIEKNPALRADTSFGFDKYIVAINELLDHVEIQRNDLHLFTLHKKSSGIEMNANLLSSGERQLIALGMECLAFEIGVKPGVENILLLDEPDVHIHPDLQERLMVFIASIAKRTNIRILIATHSTAILGAMEKNNEARVCFMRPDDTKLDFQDISANLKRILPIFGAHPLSNIFNKIPLLLVEGTDEERIWQQAVRSSNGKIRLYPCECGGKDKMDPIEKEAERIISSVYERGIGYSLRDRDDTDGTITDLNTIMRRRLQWRASENLLLTDDVLEHWGIGWEEMRQRIREWRDKKPSHVGYATMNLFVESGMPRESADLKDARNIIAGLINSSKTWEILIGQTLGSIDSANYHRWESPGSLYSALGKELFSIVFQTGERYSAR